MRATPARSSPLRPLRARADGGFCTIRSILSACRGSNGAIPPVWWRPRHGASSTVRLLCRNSPRLVAVRPRFGAVWRPKCRPPRRKTPKLGCRRRGGLRYGHNGVKSWVLWRLVEAASFRVVVCWFSACCGVMPPRARWGRRVLYQWTQAAVSRSTSPIAPRARSRGAPRCRSVLLRTRSSTLRPGRYRRSHQSNPPTTAWQRARACP